MINARVSVCMASYNGSKYVKEQVETILRQIKPDDELVVVDDGSKDDTLGILTSLKDPRVKIVRNDKNQGVIKTFERAIAECSGDIIFLADQDDRWSLDKVPTVINQIENGWDLVVHNARFLVWNGTQWAVTKRVLDFSNVGFWSNFFKNKFQGSCMAFKAIHRNAILPFPRGIEMHDSWIGLLLLLLGKKVHFLPETLLEYRRHESTVTTSNQRRPWLKIAQGRFLLMFQLAKRVIFYKLNSNARVASWK